MPCLPGRPLMLMLGPAELRHPHDGLTIKSTQSLILRGAPAQCDTCVVVPFFERLPDSSHFQ